MAEVATRAICRWCHSMCRVVIHTKDGLLVRVEEDRSDPRVDNILPATRGCLRLNALREYVYHPDRVHFPLKRKGDRGENKWEQVTWEQALGDISAKVGELSSKYGPETLAMTQGTGRTMYWILHRFMNLFGSPNLMGQGMICFGPVIGMAATVLGWPLRHRTGFTISQGADGKPKTKCALLVGINPSHAYHRLWKSVIDAKKMGTKIIVIDPRKTQTAEMADIWLQPRPGTDAALLMSMINVVIEEGLYDKEFVKKWCYGFDRLTQRAREYPPEKVSEITWVPAEKIREAARTYGTERPGVRISGMGIEHLEDSEEAIQASLILAAIVGNIDVEGGDYLPGPAKIIGEVELQLSEALSAEQRKKQIGIDRFRLLSWPGKELISEANKRFWGKESSTIAYAHYPSVLRAMMTSKPYPVKACISIASNPMVTPANTKLVYKALKSLDLYVVSDFWMTPSAQLADYVLPAAGWFERPDLLSGQGSDIRVTGGEAALPRRIEGKHDYRSEYELFSALGRRLGQDEQWPWKTQEEVFDYMLQPIGMNFKEFMEKKNGLYSPPDEYKKYERKEGFGTPTGKVELCSTVLEKLGYDPLPEFHEPKESPISRPDLAKDYPLMLITGGRIQPYWHSEHRQIESIRKRRPDPIAQVHPETAKQFGINHGDWIWIETPRGTIRQKCEYFDGMDKRVVHGEHGWWFPEQPGDEPWLRGVWQSNINILTDDDPERCNRRNGGWPLKTAVCRISKCKTYEPPGRVGATA